MSDWIGWGGGKCPIPGGVLFEYRLRDGSTGAPLTTSTAWQWEHTGSPFDIVAYRLLRAPAGGDLVERARAIAESCVFLSANPNAGARDALLGLTQRITAFASTIQREAREAALEEAAQRCEREAASHGSLNDGYIRRELANLIRALSGTVPQSGWRPIETAPKDGTHILTYNITPTLDMDTGETREETNISVSYWCFGGWMEYPASPRIIQGQKHIYWQPLPAPPTEDAK